MSGESPRVTRAVVTEADLPEPPAMVWRALTTPEILAEWLGPNDLPEAAAIGTRFAVETPGEPGGRVACEILETVPERRLSCTWSSADPEAPRRLDTVVEFELAPIPQGGTRLRIVHRDAIAGDRTRTEMCLSGRRPCGRRRIGRDRVTARRRPARAVPIRAPVARRLAA